MLRKKREKKSKLFFNISITHTTCEMHHAHITFYYMIIPRLCKHIDAQCTCIAYLPCYPNAILVCCNYIGISSNRQ